MLRDGGVHGETIDLRFQSAYIRVGNAEICIIQCSFQMSSDIRFKKFLKKGIDKSHYISVLRFLSCP